MVSFVDRDEVTTWTGNCPFSQRCQSNRAKATTGAARGTSAYVARSEFNKGLHP